MAVHEHPRDPCTETELAGRAPDGAVTGGPSPAEVDGLLRRPRTECPAHLSALRHQPPDVLSLVAPVYAAGSHLSGHAEPGPAPPAAADVVAGVGRGGSGPPAPVPAVGQGQAGRPAAPGGLDRLDVDGRAHSPGAAAARRARRTAGPARPDPQGPAAPALCDPQARD